MPVRVTWRDTGDRLSTPERRRVAADLLHSLLPTGTTLTRTCPECGSTEHGPLSAHLPDGAHHGTRPLVSVSYADTVVVVATAPGHHGFLGVDAELDTAANRDAASEAQAARRPTIASRGMDALEAWVRLEATGKALGTGLGPRSMPDDAARLHVDVTRVPRTPADLLVAVALGPDHTTSGS